MLSLLLVFADGNVITFHVKPPGEGPDEPSMEEIVEKLREAVENGTFVIPLPNGSSIIPDFLITFYDVTPEDGQYQIDMNISVS